MTTETILTSLHERAPEGSTPNALAFDPEDLRLDRRTLDLRHVSLPGRSVPRTLLIR